MNNREASQQIRRITEKFIKEGFTVPKKSSLKTLYRLTPRVKILSDFYVFDTETGIQYKDGSIQWHLNARPESFRFGVIYGHNYHRVIKDLNEFKQALLEPRFKNKILFAHNLEYDLSVLYGNIYEVDPGAIFNGRLISATNGNCKFADSMNIYKTSAENIGKLVGIEKPQLGDENLFSPNGITADVINRCSKDCEIIYEALFQIFEDSGDIKITQASLSLTYFRRFHQKANLQHNDNTAFFWDSYYGGRTEVFKLGNTHAKVIDANSMYPFAMVNCNFPNPKFLKSETIGITNHYFKKHILPHFEGCIYCTVEHKKFWLGLLPVKKDGKLLFPVGAFSGCWNFNEIRFALESGLVKIKKIDRIVYAEKMDSPFKDYVEHLYLQRIRTDNEFEKYRIKIFMNSLYGKFAQRINEESIYINDIDLHIDLIQEAQRTGTFKKLQLFNAERKDAFLIVKSKKNISLSYAIPSFSSYITSFARIHLLKKLMEMKNKIPVYCDTDSIFYEIETEIENNNALGGWKVEPKIVTQIRGLKNYRYIDLEKDSSKEIDRIKGVPTNAEKIAENIFQYSNLLKTKESLRRNLDNGILIKRTKKIKGTYDKRLINADGTTEPITLTLN